MKYLIRPSLGKDVVFEKTENNFYSELLKHNIHETTIRTEDKTVSEGKSLFYFLDSIDDPKDNKLIRWKGFLKSDKSNCDHRYKDLFSQEVHTFSGDLIKVNGWICPDCSKNYAEVD